MIEDERKGKGKGKWKQNWKPNSWVEVWAEIREAFVLPLWNKHNGTPSKRLRNQYANYRNIEANRRKGTVTEEIFSVSLVRRKPPTSLLLMLWNTLYLFS